MAKAGGDFAEILVGKKILGSGQLLQAKAVARQTGARVQDALVELGYCTAEDVMCAIAEQHGLQFIDLTEVTIPQTVIELVPESLARENDVLPMAQENGALQVLMSNPSDFELVQKLQFILNSEIQPVLATRDQIIEAINRHYGQIETESVESMLSPVLYRWHADPDSRIRTPATFCKTSSCFCSRNYRNSLTTLKKGVFADGCVRLRRTSFEKDVAEGGKHSSVKTRPSSNESTERTHRVFGTRSSARTWSGAPCS